MLADSAWHPAIIPIPCNVGGAKEPENIKWNLYKVIINEKSKMKNELHDHQAHGSKESLRFFLLELGLESSCHPTSCIRIDRQVHSVKDIFDFIFFLNTFLFQNTLIGVGCSISMYGISIRSALSRFSLEITIASRPGSPPCCKFFHCSSRGGG